MDPVIFTARVIQGSGRGKHLGTPTLNLALHQVPSALHEGIYAATVSLQGQMKPAALHYGPRPVFQDSLSCEVHLLDAHVATPPSEVTVTVIERLRDIMDFDDQESLKRQIAADIAMIRGILRTESAQS